MILNLSPCAGYQNTHREGKAERDRVRERMKNKTQKTHDTTPLKLLSPVGTTRFPRCGDGEKLASLRVHRERVVRAHPATKAFLTCVRFSALAAAHLSPLLQKEHSATG